MKEDRQFIYQIHLSDPRWIKLRNYIRDRDKVCQHCGKGKYFNVHHIRYLPNRYPWDYPENYLILLCNNCHRKEHKNMEKVNDAISEMRMHGLKSDEILNIINK